jgi:hypothetical protein
MRYLRKFEELDYSTYMDASNRMKQHGQISKGEKLSSHAENMEMKKINQMSFDVLVGETRPFNDAKFKSVSVLRQSGAKGIVCIFESGNNTHRIFSTINPDGSIVWRDSNKFVNRKSVNEYEKLVKKLATFHPEVKKLLDEMNLTPDKLKVVARTFYI